MQMRPGMRRAALAVHVVGSVGWIGAAAAYLVLGVAAASSDVPAAIRAAWIAMELVGWYVIVPLGTLALITGLIMSLGTPWGLFRHYWVLIALVLTAVSLAVLLFHLPTVTAAAGLARTADDPTAVLLGGDILHPALGLLVLIVIAVLNLYKPRGLTPYGHCRQTEAPVGARPPR